MLPHPLISVVIPLPDDRGHLLDCLRGFLRQQLNVPHEIIVATFSRSAGTLHDLVQQFPEVRWVDGTPPRINGLYNIAAAAAWGRYLYLSESHCVPQPDCLQQILDFVCQTELQVAISNSDGINANWVAEGEQRIFEADTHRWIAERKCKVSIRGTLIERSLWKRTGGMRVEFGHFSEMMIGQELKRLGVQVGFAEHSRVSHGNQTSLQALAEELIEYGEDECRSSHLAPTEDRPPASPEWKQRKILLADPARLQRKQQREAARQWLRRFVMETVPMSSARRFQWFQKFWQRAIRQGRLNYLAALQQQASHSARLSATPVMQRTAA